jgi:hypothetical protein
VRKGNAYQGYDHPDFADFLSRDEREQCRETCHWLSLSQPAHHELSTRASLNAFLIALWVARPTPTHVPLRFEEAESGVRTVARVHDRFQWVRGQAREDIRTHDLATVKAILSPLRSVYTARLRLRNALGLTFRGCVASEWQSAFVCFAAAMEALLTYSHEPRLTELADAYARLVGPDDGIDETRTAFKRLYAIRSDIVHGRASDRSAPSQNVADLAAFSDLLRRLWRAVLESQELRAVLESDDGQRKEFFVSARRS